jgi:dihydrofolate synthase/folylpolyglutamate synthase
MRSLSDWLSWQETLHPNPIDLGLARLNETLRRLGWCRPACPVITIAGTNGKGSSVALLTRILQEAGHRVATFTSPHLLRYNERIAIAETEISDASLIAAFERIDAARGDLTLTFFEFNALAALLIFETACPDAIVLEVGLGGRLDAVNAVDCDVALVTSISLDHCDWLGPDVESIGREKAGIFRPGKPAIFGSRDMPASIAAVATEVGAHLLRLGKDFDCHRDGDAWSWSAGDRRTIDRLPAPALTGDIQFDNAAAVLAVLARLSDRLPVDDDAIRRGLTTVRLSGRFQSVAVDGVQWLLDVAHNPAAARTLAGQLAAVRASDSFNDNPLATPRVLAVCSILGDKDIEGIATELRDSFDQWLVAGLSGPRAVPADRLTQRLLAAGVTVAVVAENVDTACEEAAQLARRGDWVVVFGSFLTVAGAMQWLQRRGVSI